MNHRLRLLLCATLCIYGCSDVGTAMPPTGADAATTAAADGGPDETGSASGATADGALTSGGPSSTTAGPSQPGDTTDGPPEEPSSVVQLGPVDRLIRASMTIRGIRPSLAEMEAVALDPTRIEEFVDSYLVHPGFLATVKDLYAEALLLRVGQAGFSLVYNVDYTVGPLPTIDDTTYLSLASEEPLELIARIVRDDLPLYRIFTHDKTVVSWIGATAFQIQGYDMSKRDTEPFQEVTWDDPRPAAGLLAHSMLWRRHPSNGNNYHRGRAALLALVFLCDDFIRRDVPPFGDIDFSSEEAVRTALKTNIGCVGCHQTLDPLANFLAGIHQRNKGQIEKAHGISFPQKADATCIQAPPSNDCYPMKSYNEVNEGTNEKLTGRHAGYYGARRPDDELKEDWDVSKLGQFMADDPRFAQCTARRFYGYMAQVDPDHAPTSLVHHLADALVGDDQSYNLRRMVRELVLSDEFMVSHAADPADADGVVGFKTSRPEQLARTLEDLTGFVWKGRLPAYDSKREKAGAFPLLGSDTYGYRAMAGGVDGRNVTSPSYRFSPTRMLTLQALAGEAAGFVVDRDLAEQVAGKRKLLTQVEATDADEAIVKAQIAALHRRVLGELVEPGAPAVQISYDLWSAGDGAPPDRWKMLLAAMFLDHRITFY